MVEMVARRRDALGEAEATKWKIMFWGQEECWRTERMAATEPLMYAVSRVMATWTARSEHMYPPLPASSSSSSSLFSSSMREGQSGEL